MQTTSKWTRRVDLFTDSLIQGFGWGVAFCGVLWMLLPACSYHEPPW